MSRIGVDLKALTFQGGRERTKWFVKLVGVPGMCAFLVKTR